MPWISEHTKWLVDTGERLKTADGKEVEVWEFQHQSDDDVLSAWAKHFRNHYCLDAEIDFFIKIAQDPAKLFTLSIGLLGDLAAAINPDELPPGLGSTSWIKNKGNNLSPGKLPITSSTLQHGRIEETWKAKEWEAPYNMVPDNPEKRSPVRISILKSVNTQIH